MSWRHAVAGLALAFAAAGLPASAQTLYAASFRTGGLDVIEGIAGSLYTVNLGSGLATFVAPIRVNGTQPVGVTGIAVHPETSVVYGITPPNSPTNPQALITMDVVTGRATVVGELRHPGSDISFNRAGVLFAWLPRTSQLGIVNLSNGAITPIGTPRAAGTPSGLAIDAEGNAYIASEGAGGTLDRVDLGTGAVTRGPQMTGAPFPAGVNSMSFTPSGLLLAVNSNGGAPAATRLVTINTATGNVSTIGTLPDDTDALTFSPEQRRGGMAAIDVQTLALLILGVIALVLALIGWFVGRR